MDDFPIEALLSVLDADPELAKKKLEEIYERLNKFFQCGGFPDPEDLAQEVVHRVLVNLSRGAKITAPYPGSYFLGVAVNVRHEQRKKRKAKKDRETELIYDPPAPRPSFANLTPAEMRVLLEECMRQLDAEEKKLLLDYYSHGREWISGQTGESPTYITLKVYRIREKVRRFLKLEKK